MADIRRLFETLCERAPATATHSLRTTLGCVQWSHELALPAEVRDAVQLAALLHDVGKIVAPGRVLDKPMALTDEEVALLARCRRAGWDVVRHKVANPQVLEIITQAGTWFDGSRWPVALSGSQLPLGSRVLAIVDAFDAMTSRQAYRPALSRSQACEELLRCAGSQFDPDLVHSFIDREIFDPQLIREIIDDTQRFTLYDWLLPDDACRDARHRTAPATPLPGRPGIHLYQASLLESLRDAVIFVDRHLGITYWNPCAVRMSGLPAEQAQQLRWRPALLELRDERGVRLRDDDCPVRRALASGQIWQQRMIARGPDRRQLTVEVQVSVVPGPDGRPQGASLILRDLSPEESLRDHCQTLQLQATTDALTGVANRAEFDRVHASLVDHHRQAASPYSLILCDIDHFKSVNDTYGHPAGDEILRQFARVLKSQCREHDVVARYGGEEFAILCPDCGLSAARSRAERIRQMVANAEQPVLGNRSLTASFGVTRLRPGESLAEMLERCDLALYEAKHRGRNCVVATDPGGECSVAEIAQSDLAAGVPVDQILTEQHLVTPVPMAIAIEKLRGYIDEIQAEVMSIDPPWVRLRIDGLWVPQLQRRVDRNLRCLMHVSVEENVARLCDSVSSRLASGAGTRIHVIVAAQRLRDRQRQAVIWFARKVLGSFREYLVAEALPGEMGEPCKQEDVGYFSHR